MSDYDSQAGRRVPSDPQPDSELSAADDGDVASALSSLARLTSQVDEVEEVLREIAEFAVTAVPRADGAGVTLVDPDGDRGELGARVLAWAATAPFVREIDRLQYEVCGEGPSLTAMDTRRAQVSGSLGSDVRWPRFGGRVARLAVHSGLALPLQVVDTVVGAITIYARDRDAFGDHAVRLGTRFAGPAAVSVGNARTLQIARDQAANLRAAMTSRAVIDQAIGILRSRSGDTADEAFDRLRRLSQAEGVKLAVVAQRLVDEAVRRAHARHDPS